MDAAPDPRPERSDLAELLVEEHRVIFRLLDALAADRHDRFPLAHRLIDELAAHTAAEQQLLYPALRDIVAEGVAMADRSQTDHGAMRAALVTLERSHPGQPEFEQALDTLTTEMQSHVPFEENEVLPALREVIGTDKMAELAVIYVQLKENVPSGLQGLAPELAEPEFRAW